MTSSAFVTHNDGGRSASIRFDRYQNFEGITQVGNTYDTPQIRILHVPSLDFDTIGQPLKDTPLRWSVDGSAAGLNRSEPGYNTGTIGRFDLYPHLELPLHLDGWTFRPEVAARETFYTESQIPTATTPLPGNASVNRSDLEASFELRPPVLMRDFKVPSLEKILGSDLRHTIEPDLQYRYVAGVNNFSSIPRFDGNDIVSNTNEVEYSVTQRLFLKHLHPKALQPAVIFPRRSAERSMCRQPIPNAGAIPANGSRGSWPQNISSSRISGAPRRHSGAMCWPRRSTSPA